MAEFSVYLLKKKEGQTYDESEFLEYLKSFGLYDISVGETDYGYIRYNLKKGYEYKDNKQSVDKTIFLKVDKNGIIEKIIWADSKEDSYQKYNDGITTGCLIIIGIIAVIGVLGWFLVTGIMDAISDSDYEDDCNDSYIEMDYNGDGEKDAEDYRIQTEGC